jgi:hypothetical protein
MTEYEWMTAATFTVDQIGDGDDGLARQLAVTTERFALPLAVCERLYISLGNTLGEMLAREHAAIELTIFVPIVYSAEMRQTWGFFVIEKGGGAALPRRVNVFVYPEQSPRTYESAA